MAKPYLTIPLVFATFVLAHTVNAQQERHTASGSAHAAIVDPVSVAALGDLHLWHSLPLEENAGKAPASPCSSTACTASTAILRVQSRDAREYQVFLPRSVAVPLAERQLPLLVAVHRSFPGKDQTTTGTVAGEANAGPIIAVEGSLADPSDKQTGRFNAYLPILVILE